MSEPWSVVVAYSKGGEGEMKIWTFPTRVAAEAKFRSLSLYDPKVLFSGAPIESCHCDTVLYDSSSGKTGWSMGCVEVVADPDKP